MKERLEKIRDGQPAEDVVDQAGGDAEIGVVGDAGRPQVEMDFDVDLERLGDFPFAGRDSMSALEPHVR